jgi:hypothetical protein
MNRRTWALAMFEDRRLTGRARRVGWWIATEAETRGFAVHLRMLSSIIDGLGGIVAVRRALAELAAFGWVAPVTAHGRDKPDTWVRLTTPEPARRVA